MEKEELQNRIKELELGLSHLNASRNLVEQANHPILILKGENMILELANDALYKIWNVGKEALGKPFLEILPEMKDQPFMGLLLDVLHNSTTHHGYNQPAHFTRADGEIETVYFNFVYQPYKENDGTVSGVIVFANDVTEQVLAFNKLEESETNFRQLAELLPQKISQAKADGNVFYYNQKWLSYSGFSIEELKDNGWAKIMHPDEQDEIAKQWQHSVKTGNDFEMEIRLLNKKGEYKWHLSRASAVRDDKGNIIKWLGVATEIQKQKDNLEELETNVAIINSELVIANKELVFQNSEKEKRADELVVANKELVFQNSEKEKRAAELVVANKELVFQNSEKEKRADELVVANKELVFQNSEKEKRADELSIVNKELESFNYISSHDLQEPLRKIQAFAGRLIADESLNLSYKGKDYLLRMQDAATRMQSLIVDLLAYSRATSSEGKFETIDLNTIIKSVKEDLSEIIAEKNAIIEVNEMCDAQIIPFQFRQLMDNIIGNALKFAKPDLPPHIIVKSRIIKGSEVNNQLLSEKKYCHITVTDNGIGFEPQYKDHIFGLFKRLHDKEKIKGTGIGLAIVKKIVDNQTV